MSALQQVPLCTIAGRTPSVLFSLLRPGTRIRPHHGFTNARLICHLPLIVPSDRALRVGNETRAWREGELFIFDDSIEHAAWNLSKELRVVLLFDVWRPELSDKEPDSGCRYARGRRSVRRATTRLDRLRRYSTHASRRLQPLLSSGLDRASRELRRPWGGPSIAAPERGATSVTQGSPPGVS